VLCAALALACGGSGSEQPSNVILISIDTLRPDRLGCYGHDRDTSPAIDDLAAGGARFTDVTAASPWTLPSHASMLTGMYASRHGVKSHLHRLHDEIPTLATLLAARGFHTMAVVNYQNLTSRFGLDRGFESFSYVSEFSDTRDPNRTIQNRGEEIVDQALAWLEDRDDRPFFLFLHFYDVHTDLTPAPRFRDLFVQPYAGPITGATRQLAALRRAGTTISEADVQHLFDLYDAEIRQLDEQIGRLVRYLGEEGSREETLIILTSDHGEEFQEHGSLLHGRTYYQEVIAIPLLLNGPGVPAGLTVQEPVHLVDVAPTLLRLLGLPAPSNGDGVDLSVYWHAPETAPCGRFLFAEADQNNERPDMHRMLRVGPNKLLYNRFSGEMKLYDLSSDAEERNDLSAMHENRLTTLRQRIEAFIESERPGPAVAPPTPEEIENLGKLGYVR
jgi:arylsulfatase A-like enzyme